MMWHYAPRVLQEKKGKGTRMIWVSEEPVNGSGVCEVPFIIICHVKLLSGCVYKAWM